MSFDPAAQRQASLENWEAAASGWRRRRDLLDAYGAPVANWMIEAVAPQPGEHALELAAGLGEIGLLTAELVAPNGDVTISDQAEAMLDGARERAAELGIQNVSFRALNAESMDLPLASFEIALCRWGYMLMVDPAAAFSETRRVLASGGRLALAVWDSIEHNPWAGLPALELLERGLAPSGSDDPAPRPGPFALGDAERLRRLIEDAGFTDVSVGALELPRRQAGFEEFWETTLDLSRMFHDAVMVLPQDEIDAVKRGLEQRFAPFTAADGTLEIPGRTLVASASA
jgi:SAM-dependent methyltransferase